MLITGKKLRGLVAEIHACQKRIVINLRLINNKITSLKEMSELRNENLHLMNKIRKFQIEIQQFK